MNGMDHTVAALLDRHSPATAPAAARPDWADVERRAAAGSRRRRPRPGRGGLLLAAAISTVLAGSALAGQGPGATLVRIVRGDEAVPRSALGYNRWPARDRVRADEARLVIRVGRLKAWVAPNASGGYCSGTISPSGGGTVCETLSNPATRIIDNTFAIQPTSTHPGPDSIVRPIVNATAPLGTARLVVVFQDGTRRALHRSTAHFPNFVFFADSRELPAANMRPGHRPAKLVAFDGAGRVTGVQTFSRQEFVPRSRVPELGIGYGTRQVPPRIARHLGTPPGVKVDPSTTRIVLRLASMRVWIAPTATGGYCTGTYTLRRSAASCRPNVDPTRRVTDNTAALTPGAAAVVKGWLLRPIVNGTAPIGTRTVVLTFEDGTQKHLHVFREATLPGYVFFADNGMLHRQNLRPGARPLSLIARNHRGRVTGRLLLPPGEFHVP